jgi:hypothetical protein
MADFWDSALDTLTALAPSIATALGGPVAGMAVTAIERAFGLDPTGDKTAALQAVANATPDQIIALKKVDNDFAVQMRQLDIDLVKISVSDRDSARKREIEVKDNTPKVLAGLVIIGYMAVQWYILGHIIDQGMREIVLRTLGTIDGALMLVLSYYFGSMNKAASSK